MFECVRCTRIVEGEEKYLMFKDEYCSACMDTITHDQDYAWIIGRNYLLSRFEQIEN